MDTSTDTDISGVHREGFRNYHLKAHEHTDLNLDIWI